MKKVLMLFVCIMTVMVSNAQDFEKGGNYISIGYGLDPWGHRHVTGSGLKRTVLGPFIASYERGITDVLGIGRIGVGGSVAQSFYTQKYKDVWGESVYRRSRLSLMAKAAYHFEFDIDKMDFYAGAGVAAHIYNDHDEVVTVFGNTVKKESHVAIGHYVFAGIRYYFTDAIGVYAEAGHGLAAVNGGIVFKF